MADKMQHQGELVKLRSQLERAPDIQARAIREVAQKECESDLKAYDALIGRANALLAASGVAVSLLVGFTKEAVIGNSTRTTLLAVALVAATVAVLLVILGLRLCDADTQVGNQTIAGKQVTEVDDPNKWQRDHELSLALAYFDVRQNLAARHRRRARLIHVAQWAYLAFLMGASALGLTIAL